jgi:hypothetical protein
MASSKKSKAAARRPARPAPRAARASPKPSPKKAQGAKPAPAKGAQPAKPSAGKPSTGKKVPVAEVDVVPPVQVITRADGRRHLLSLSFVRDGDEFLARMETDTGHITELKNRALDQLLTLVAGELEDLLE